MMLACNMGRMTPAEALKGATIYAAKAINRDGKTGSLQAGKQADFAIIDAPNPNFWMYHFRPNCCKKVFVKGEKI
jgi:imidazolonepropionase